MKPLLPYDLLWIQFSLMMRLVKRFVNPPIKLEFMSKIYHTSGDIYNIQLSELPVVILSYL